MNDHHEAGRAIPAPEPAPEPRDVSVGWRVAAGLVAVVSLPAVVVAWFLAVITLTGCFVACDPSGADPIGGLLLMALAGAFVVAGAVCTKLAATGRTAGSRRVAIVSAIAAVVAVVFSITT